MNKFRSWHKHAQYRAQAATTGDERSQGTGRRRLLTGIGAIGLLASASIFGNEDKALAAPNLCASGCCDLIYCPNESFSTCKSHASYIWYCSNQSGTFSCECCEAPGHSASYCVS
jgi:hypothetical protein